MSVVVRLYGDRTLHKIVSRVPGVREAVKDQAEEIGRRAEARLAAHRVTGDTTVSVEHGRTDSYVYLDDTRGQGAVLSIEFGHADRRTGRAVPGLYVLLGAAGLV